MTNCFKFTLFVLISMLTSCVNSTFETQMIPTLAPTAELPSESRISTSQTILFSTTPLPTNQDVVYDANSSLALQLGFFDEQVQKAASEGVRLKMVYSNNVNEKPYVVFFLEKNFEPRIINDYQTIILVYEGTLDTINDFVHRIEVRSNNLEGIENEVVSQTHRLQVENDVITSYLAVGFSPIAERLSTDTESLGREYYAVVMQYSDLYYILTFVKEPLAETYSHLFDFSIANRMCEDEEFSYFDYSYYDNCSVEPEDVLFFQEEWQYFKPIPSFHRMPSESMAEKALYAIGCDFSDLRPRRQTYENSEFIVYACDWVRPAKIDYLEPSKLVTVFRESDQLSQSLLWSLYIPPYREVQSAWGDANLDSVPDITLSVTKDMGGTGGWEFLGSRFYQPLRSGKLIDIMYGVSLATSQMENILFEDLDDDGIAELVDYAIMFGRLEEYMFVGISQAVSRIYRLDSDYYYILATRDFDSLCLDEITLLSPEVKNYPLNKLLLYIGGFGEYFSGGDGNYDDYLGLYHGFIETLFTCDVVGVKEQNRGEFILALQQYFPEGCAGFIYSLNYDDYITYTNQFPLTDFISQSQPDYWPDLFDDYAYECGTADVR